jgi:hypothetical protein
MHYFLYPSKDAFITNQPNLMLKNAGLDEVVEVEKTIQPKSCIGARGPVISRTLIQFDLTDISASIATGSIPTPEFTLNLRCSQADEIPLGYGVVVYPMAMPWVMGTGYKFDGRVEADGVSWKFSDGYSTKWWASSSLVDCSGGGVWYTDVSASASGSAWVPTGSLMAQQQFNYQSSDIRVDVTHIVAAWMSGSVPNNGFILLHSGEGDAYDYGKLRFFSKETNTIYQPYLDVAWDNVVFETSSLSGTGSLDPINTRDAIVSLSKLQQTYKSDEVVRVDVFGRKKYPQKTFTNRLSDYIEPQYLPYDSFYAIRDAETEMVVVPFDKYTRLSCDGNGNYFMLDTAGLPQERYYRIEIRSEQSGSINTFVSPLVFKISR